MKELEPETLSEEQSVPFEETSQIQFEGINDGPKIKSKFGDSKNSLTKILYPYFQNKEMKYLKNAVNIQPDIVIKLHLSVEESMRRKPDNNIDKIKAKHTIVENLKFPESEVVDVDATQPLEQEITQIVFLPIPEITLEEVNDINKFDTYGSTRGDKGFGSSGK